METPRSTPVAKFFTRFKRARSAEAQVMAPIRRELPSPDRPARLLGPAGDDPSSGALLRVDAQARNARRARLGAAMALAGGSDMLSPAVAEMLTRLEAFLPAPAPAGQPTPLVAVVRAEEKQLGLGQWRLLDESTHFPVARKGVQVGGAARFQLWDGSPDLVEGAVGELVQDVLAMREQLRTDGFLELKLKNVSIVDQPQAGSWRQTAEFELVYEFHFTDTDQAGGLIARIPTELRTEYGAMLISGDLTAWHADAAAPLNAGGGKGPVVGLASLEFLPGAAPADTVEITRTFDGAGGAPAPQASFADFLTAVAGPSPASRHATFTFASLSSFGAELGAAGDPVEFADALGNPQSYDSRSLAFAQPVELPFVSDRLEISYGGGALGVDQVFYVRVLRGQTNPT